MNQPLPHIITEGATQYQIGIVKADHIHYNFNQILVYLEIKGKLLFGKNFKIYEDDMKILYKLCVYFIKDHASCERFGIDLNKGILLSGPVGCGKTSLMKILRHLVPHIKPYEVIPTRNITFGFNNLGFKTIEEFGNNKLFCFDDLGVEPIGRHFGKDCNVMGEVLLSRYELLLKNKILTHATTNLNAQELEERYGNRVRSRMRLLFNLIAFDKSCADKRG
ncbi:MAG: ATPase [Flavobacteriaceae bacterium]